MKPYVNLTSQWDLRPSAGIQRTAFLQSLRLIPPFFYTPVNNIMSCQMLPRKPSEMYILITPLILKEKSSICKNPNAGHFFSKGPFGGNEGTGLFNFTQLNLPYFLAGAERELTTLRSPSNPSHPSQGTAQYSHREWAQAERHVSPWPHLCGHWAAKLPGMGWDYLQCRMAWV